MATIKFFGEAIEYAERPYAYAVVVILRVVISLLPLVLFTLLGLTILSPLGASGV